jgi:hypothetical protein
VFLLSLLLLLLPSSSSSSSSSPVGKLAVPCFNCTAAGLNPLQGRGISKGKGRPPMYEPRT